MQGWRPPPAFLLDLAAPTAQEGPAQRRQACPEHTWGPGLGGARPLTSLPAPHLWVFIGQICI